MALATHPTRTVIAVLGTPDIPSDLAGRHYVRLRPNAVEPVHDLAARLRAAGCDTDITGADWLNPARFPDREHPAQPSCDDRQPSRIPEPSNPSHEETPQVQETSERFLTALTSLLPSDPLASYAKAS